MSRIIQVQAGQSNVDLNRQLLNAGDKTLISDKDYLKLDPGVWASILTDVGPGMLITAPIALSSITTAAQVVATITPGFAGRITHGFAIVTTAATTAAKLATVQIWIDQDGGGSLPNTAIGGGIIAMTSANATPAGKILPSTFITFDNAANPSTFGATSTITFVTTALPTAFIEGNVIFGCELLPINKTGPLTV